MDSQSKLCNFPSSSLSHILFIYLLIYLFIQLFIIPCHWLSGSVFANVPGDWGLISGRVLYQRLGTCLTLSIIRYVSRVKWYNTGKEVTPSPTPR